MTATERPKTAGASRTLLGVLFAFGAAASYGSSQVMARSLSDEASSLIGAFIALTFGTIGFAFLSARRARHHGPGDFKRGALYFVGAGVFSSMGVVLMFQALSRGEVVVVSPVLATNPLFTLFFASIFLRGIERITPRVVVGALLVFAGVVVLTFA